MSTKKPKPGAFVRAMRPKQEPAKDENQAWRKVQAGAKPLRSGKNKRPLPKSHPYVRGKVDQAIRGQDSLLAPEDVSGANTLRGSKFTLRSLQEQATANQSFEQRQENQARLEAKWKQHNVDGATANRMRRGKMKIEGRLDLHGLTKNQAWSALNAFLTQAHSQNKRCLLLITGKGKDRAQLGAGVLRQEVPNWLALPPLNDLVLSIRPAQPKDGGEGALYILLKRQRQKS